MNQSLYIQNSNSYVADICCLDVFFFLQTPVR
jgi:hypothetical protein